jgi:hypothetical protein
MFGTPNHLYDCGKIDYRCPFWWIGEPAPLLFESVGQQCAISYAARADKKFQNFHGARFLPPASPHIDETSSFYFFWRGGLWMRRGAKGDSEAVYLVCLVYLVYLVERNQRNQKDQINQMNQIPATRWEMCDCKT